MIQQKRLNNKPNWLPLGALLLIVLTLFPYGWLAERWRLFAWVMGLIFSAELAHVLGHFVLFAAVGTAVLLTFPRLQTRPRLYFGLMLVVGFLQEILQLATFKGRPFAANELLDIAVDLLGAAAVYFWMTRDWRLRN